MKRFLRNYKLSVPAAVVVVAGLCWLAFGYFAVQTLFIDDKVSEAAPTFDVDAVTPTTIPGAGTTVPAPGSTPVGTPTSTTPPSSAAPTTPAPQVVVEQRGLFESREHPTSGDAIVLGNGTGQRFLRFENFATDNGPDLNVYLVNSSAGTSDHVDLGDLKGNIGEQNYEIPADVDLAVYDQVVIWCVRFGVAFGLADLS